MKIKVPRGTRDICGELITKFNTIYEKSKKISQSYDYEEIKTPIFENTDLFVRGIGEDSDIVFKEMYTFKDKGERSLTLRPEGTASVIRHYLEQNLYNEKMKKFFYYGPMFRYERPQAGRYREFFQLGVEAIGENNPYIDVEIINMGHQLLIELGIENIKININSVGCKECRKKYRDELIIYLEQKREKLCNDCQRRICKNSLRVLDCKNEKCKEELKNTPSILDHLCSPCSEHYEKVKEGLNHLEIEYIENPKLVRGLDYYTNTVFEFVSTELGAQGTILAGGRYNDLIREFSKIDKPAIGFAAGVDRLSSLIKMKSQTTQKVIICWLGAKCFNPAFELMIKLRNKGINVVFNYDEKNLKNQLKKANKIKANFAIIIGEEELEKKMYKLKNLENSFEEDLNFDGIMNCLLESRYELSARI